MISNLSREKKRFRKSFSILLIHYIKLINRLFSVVINHPRKYRHSRTDSVLDLQIPELETRCAILQSKAASHGVELLSPVTEYIAGLYQSNIRELEGGLNQLLAFCEIRNLEPTLDIAHSVFGGRASRPKHINAKGVIDKCSKYFNIPVDELLGPKRDKDIVVPRQIAMYLLRQELKLSFPKIAQELGRKDHTTAIHSVEKIHSMFSYDMAIKSAVREIKDLLYV